MKKCKVQSILSYTRQLIRHSTLGRREFLLVSLFVSSTLTQAQTYCETSILPEPEQVGGDGDCSNYWNYAPDISGHFPIKTVRIMMHVMHQSVSDPLNFVPGDEYVLSDIVDDLNNKMGAFQQVAPNPFNSPHYPDSRVRFSFNPATDIHYYVDPNAWARTHNPVGYFGVYNNTVALNPNLSPADLSGYLHILVTGITSNGDGPCKIGGATYSSAPWIGFGSWWCGTIGTNAGIYTDVISSISGNFRHELGHNLIGLGHIYDTSGDGCADTQDCSNDPDLCLGSTANTNNLMDDWQTCQCGISACQLGKLHYRIENVTALFARLRPDHCTFDANQTITISTGEDVYWTAKREMHGNLVVESGARLTIQCQISFPWGGKLIVKPGGKLVVEGNGKLTNICGEFWSGIEVWGDNAHNQLPSSQPTYQGMVVLKNGATIEHAREAIVLGQDGVWNTFGGVVRATDAHFINCRRAVAFGPYQNTTNGGTPIGNRSFFARCDFAVDNNYRGGEDFHAHVSMWKVDGITFTACDFKNQQTTITESAKLGCGIVSIDASYRILGQCTTNPPWVGDVCPSYTPTTFIGLDHGINARNFSTTRSFIVDHGLFEDNVCGVYANGVVGFQVRNSQFKVGGNEVADMNNTDELYWNDRHRAVFSTESWAFAIDDNTVEQSGSHDLTEGIVVGYSHDHNDVVFRNSATGLERGYIGEGICADLAPGYTATRGLWFLCNGNNNDEVNFWSRKVTADQINPLNDHTIRLNQGTPSRPADNTFDQWPTTSPNWDFYVTTSHSPISYWHRNTGNFVPVNYTLSLTGLFPAVSTTLPANNCASKVQTTIPWNPNYPSGMAPGPVVNYLLSEKLAFGNTRYLYEQLIDDGNTDEVVEEIQESWPQDAWLLRDYLLSKSPYLSATSLKEMVLRNILPAAMVTEILVANPEATRQDGFLTWLQETSGHPLPEYMLGMVVASWDQRTYRDALEGAMTFHHAEMSQAANMLLHHYQTLPFAEEDTTSVPMDSVLWVWQQVRTPAARYAEALTWLQLGNYVQATGVIEAIPAEHDLRSPEALERQRMLDLISFLQVLNGAGRSEMQLTSGEVATLQALMGEAYDRPAAWISNLLCFGYQLCRPPLTGGEEEDEDRRSLPYTALSSNAAQTQAVLSIHPNPASTWVALDYDLLVEPTAAAMAIRDLTGREVYRRTLTDRKQELVWDTRQLAPGSYTVVLLNGGRQLRAEKLIIRQ